MHISSLRTLIKCTSMCAITKLLFKKCLKKKKKCNGPVIPVITSK